MVSAQIVRNFKVSGLTLELYSISDRTLKACTVIDRYQKWYLDVS